MRALPIGRPRSPPKTRENPLSCCRRRGDRTAAWLGAETLDFDQAGVRAADLPLCRYRSVWRCVQQCSSRLFGDLLAQPLAVVLPCPAAGHRASGHCPHRTLDPDRRVTMDDPQPERDDRCCGVDDGCDPFLLDREMLAEPSVPDGDAAPRRGLESRSSNPGRRSSGRHYNGPLRARRQCWASGRRRHPPPRLDQSRVSCRLRCCDRRARQQRQKFPAPIPPASVRDNLLLGLPHRPGRTPDSGAVPATGREQAIEEARQSGNSELDITADWIDY